MCDREDGTYLVSYEVEQVGQYSLSIRCEDEHIKASPFSITADAGTPFISLEK